MVIANRTLARAQTLAAEIKGYAVDLSALDKELAEADIVVSCTASTLPHRHRGSGGGGGARAAPPSHPHGRPRRTARHRPGGRRSRRRLSVLHRRPAAARSTKTASGARWPPAMRGTCSRRKSRASSPIRARTMPAPRSACCARARKPSGSKPWTRRSACSHAGRTSDEVIDFLANTLTNRLLHTPTQALRQASESGRSRARAGPDAAARGRTRPALTRRPL